MHPRTPASCLLLAASLCLASCLSSRASVSDELHKVERLLDEGSFGQAVQLASELREKEPERPELQELHRKATLGFLLDEGRKLTFENRDVEALELFERARAIAGDSRQAEEWYDKTRGKLAERWNVVGEELHAEGNVDGAMEAYRQAIQYDPNLISAREGAAQLMLLKNFREGLSARYYNEGVRALHDYFLRVSRGRFQYTQKYDPENERAIAREGEVERRIAEQRFVEARELEEKRQFAAARNEYYIVLLMEPENERAKAGYERMKVEAEAKRLLDEASMATLRKEFDKTRELLQKGVETSVLQKDIFVDRLASLDEDRVNALYEEAVTLEGDFRFDEAIEIYRGILDERQWYKDARARLEFVEERIQRSAELYEQVAQTVDADERLKLLGQIELYWPDYRDVREQIVKLRRSLGLDDELSEPHHEATPQPAEEPKLPD